MKFSFAESYHSARLLEPNFNRTRILLTPLRIGLNLPLKPNALRAEPFLKPGYSRNSHFKREPARRKNHEQADIQ